MKSKDSRIIIENQQSDFLYQKSKSNLSITFNRISFIFFVFFIIFFIYSIHLIHLGSRKIDVETIDYTIKTDKLYRADIVDRNQEYLVKTINSIDIGISPTKIIDEKKLLINLRFIFPNKDFSEVKKRIKKGDIYVATDVFPEEPVKKNDPIRKLKNVLFSAHRAGALEQAFFDMGEIVLKDMSLILKKRAPKFCKRARSKTVNLLASKPVAIN